MSRKSLLALSILTSSIALSANAGNLPSPSSSSGNGYGDIETNLETQINSDVNTSGSTVSINTHFFDGSAEDITIDASTEIDSLSANSSYVYLEQTESSGSTYENFERDSSLKAGDIDATGSNLSVNNYTAKNSTFNGDLSLEINTEVDTIDISDSKVTVSSIDLTNINVSGDSEFSLNTEMDDIRSHGSTVSVNRVLNMDSSYGNVQHSSSVEMEDLDACDSSVNIATLGIR